MRFRTVQRAFFCWKAKKTGLFWRIWKRYQNFTK